MNNKSTENLLESSGSIEELHVPPLDLKQLNDDKSHNPQNSDSERSLKSKPKRVKNNFLVEESGKENETVARVPPMPAVRKLSLPPIASKRNGKDTKDSSNQLTRNQHIQSNDTIRIVSERPAHPSNNTKVHSNEHESESDVSQSKQSINDNANKIELKTFVAQAKNNLKSIVGVAEVNEETTSFVSYEEKHEKEDNSERLSSNHSSVASKDWRPKNDDEHRDDGKHGVNNDAFVQDPDDNVDVEKPRTLGGKSKSNKKKEKKPKAFKISKEKRKKRSPPQHEIEQAVANEECDDDIPNTYDFKKVIGVWIHETSALKFDRSIRQPRVRVSFYNANDGKLLQKSNPLRNAVLNYEPTHVTFIQPILSNSCTFKDSSQIECDWNNELLIINEDIRHIQKHHVIIFFEIVDIFNTNRSLESIATNGWYPICWAFLKPGDGKNYSNIDVQCALQLHYYQRSLRAKRSIIDEWKAPKRIKYPAYLTVTVGGYQPETTGSVSLTRPMSVLEEETTGDIYTCASDGDDQIDEESHQLTAHSVAENPVENRQQSLNRPEATKILKIKPRLPGQQCKCPNRIVYKHNFTNHGRGTGANRSQYGSMIAKFNLSGTLLAFHSTAQIRTNHEIVVLNVNQLQVTHNLMGHLGIVYDLDWLGDSVLVSVSTDRTAIVWYLTQNNFKMKVLPHPSFVYACKWLSKSMDNAHIATGGRDCVLRIWKISTDNDADIELCDELIQHENYITSLAASKKSTKIYSADWNGVLLQWSLKKGDSGNDVGPLYQMKRKIKIFPKSIARIELHAKFNRLFVQCINDPLIYTIETTSAVVIQTIKYSDHDHNALMEFRNTFTVSPCGSLLFVKSPNEDQLKCIRLSNEEQIADIRLPIPLTTRKYSVTSLAYHPNKNLMVCSIFGDLINASLFFVCNESDTEQTVGQQSNDLSEFYGFNDNLNQSYHALDEWQKNHEQEFIAATDDGIKSIAIDSILNRIDDLFFMAIQSPKQNEDNDGGVGGNSGGQIHQFKEVQEFLEKIRMNSSESKADGPRTGIENQPNDSGNRDDIEYLTKTHSNEPSSQSGDSNRHDSKHYRLLPAAKPMSRRRDASQSDTSQHTFDVEPLALKHDAAAAPQVEDNERSNATFSVQSDGTSNQSNLTFEISKTN